MRAIILTAVVALILPDIYISAIFIRGTLWRLLWWMPTAAALAATAAFLGGFNPQWIIRLLFFLLLCVALPKLIFCIFSAVGHAAAMAPALAGMRRAADIAGAVLAAAVAAVFVCGFTFGWKHLAVHRTTLRFADLPAAFDGYRIVHFSDLHVGSFGSDTRFVRRLVERINREEPDAVAFTGDIVNSSYEELAPFGSLLSQIRARDGVYSVIGNHDYSEYNRWPTRDGAARSLAEIERAERFYGWHLLMNESRVVRRGGDSIAFVGVESTGRPPFPSRGDLPGAVAALPDGVFKVLLSHDPSHWRAEVLPGSDVDLMLAGHTHAMQFRLWGFSPSAWTYDEWGGAYDEGGRKLYVSTGAGGTAPFRFGAWPCIDVITLKRK